MTGLSVPQTHLAMQLGPASEEHVLAEARGAPAAALARGGVDHLQLRAPRHPVHAEPRRLPGLPSAGVAHPCRRGTPVTQGSGE